MIKKTRWGIFCLFLCMVLLPVKVNAEDREKISKVKLTFDYDLDSDDLELSIESGSNNYTVTDWEVVNEPDDGKWGNYESPKVEIYIHCEDDYYFSGSGESNFTFSGNAVKYVDADREDDKTLIVLTVILKPIYGKIGNPSDLEFTDAGKASWVQGYNASKYELKLYSGSTNTLTVTTKESSYDFGDNMKSAGTYTYKIRAVSSGSYNSEWVTSEEVKISQGTTSTTTKWVQDSTGWRYRNGDNSYQVNSWFQDEDKIWYHFNSSGYMQTGWLQDNGTWYYLSSSGAMKTGWIQDNGTWYYLSSSGAMKTGWILDVEKWYYLESSGAMLLNCQTPDGYQLGSDGAWIQ